VKMKKPAGEGGGEGKKNCLHERTPEDSKEARGNKGTRGGKSLFKREVGKHSGQSLIGLLTSDSEGVFRPREVLEGTLRN